MEEECTHRFIDLYSEGHWHCRECPKRDTIPGFEKEVKEPINILKSIKYIIKSFIGLA